MAASAMKKAEERLPVSQPGMKRYVLQEYVDTHAKPPPGMSTEWRNTLEFDTPQEAWVLFHIWDGRTLRVWDKHTQMPVIWPDVDYSPGLVPASPTVGVPTGRDPRTLSQLAKGEEWERAQMMEEVRKMMAELEQQRLAAQKPWLSTQDTMWGQTTGASSTSTSVLTTGGYRPEGFGQAVVTQAETKKERALAKALTERMKQALKRG